MKKRLILSAAVLGLCAGAAAANELDVNVSNNAARITGTTTVAPRTTVEAGWLHHVDRGNVAHVGLHMVDLATGGPQPIEAGLGGRVVYYDSDIINETGWGLPLGGMFRFNLPDADRFQVGGSLYYAPQVLSFGGGDEYWEVNAYIGYEVLREGAIYAGFRFIRANFDDLPRTNMDTGVHLGLKLRF